MGILQYMTPEEGDVQQTWDPSNEQDVANAKQVFDTLMKQGCLAYTVTAEGQGEQLREFDPSLGKIIITPAMRGG